ncbi:hypothetical protein [Butyrivibrio fibrisolvens]|uniref:hypothetical protein n=1 Tax=Butyrivibrio fibrisolvens TaxID=831 RepID=UPI00041A07FF|nr:hypothetical protein [Butyrivibrio fibrisolvens]
MKQTRIIILITLLSFLVACGNKVDKENSSISNSKVYDSKESAESSQEVVHRSLQLPSGFDESIFEQCNFILQKLGKSKDDITREYVTGNITNFSTRDKIPTFVFPTYARNGQSGMLGKKIDASPVEYFIFGADNLSVGHECCGGFESLSYYISGVDTLPVRVKASGTDQYKYYYCWRFLNGYRIVEVWEFPGSIKATGYIDLVDPTQCESFRDIYYSQLESHYSCDEMPSNLFYMVMEPYEDSGNTVQIDTSSSYGFHRIIFGDDKRPDSYYLDRYCGYEKIDTGKYLIKVKCYDDEYSYLFEDVDNGDGTGARNLYFNDVDGWNYSDNYIENSLYSFSRPYTYSVGTDSGFEANDVTNNIQDTDQVTTDESANESANESAKESVDEIESTNQAGEYYCCLCMLYKQDNEYYIYPIYPDEDCLICTSDANKTNFLSMHGRKISENATVSIATGLDFTDEDFDIPHYTYEEYNFYDVVEEMFENGHWKMLGVDGLSKAWYFTVDGMEMPNTLIITIDENGIITSLKDYYGD